MLTVLWREIVVAAVVVIVNRFAMQTKIICSFNLKFLHIRWRANRVATHSGRVYGYWLYVTVSHTHKHDDGSFIAFDCLRVIGFVIWLGDWSVEWVVLCFARRDCSWYDCIWSWRCRMQFVHTLISRRDGRQTCHVIDTVTLCSKQKKKTGRHRCVALTLGTKRIHFSNVYIWVVANIWPTKTLK